MLTRKPCKGDRIEMGGVLHTVLRTPEGDDNICHMIEDGHDKPTSFIWRFCDTLNVLAVLVTPPRRCAIPDGYRIADLPISERKP